MGPDTATAAWGFTIQGIGQEGADASNDQRQLLFASSALRGHEELFRVASNLGYEVWPVLNVEGLPSPDREQEFFQWSNRFSAIDFTLEGQDRVAEKFLHVQTFSDGSLQSDLSAGATQMDTNLTGGELENKVVYIEGETIKVGAETATAGTYDIDTRGAFGTDDVKHLSGADIYTSVPDWEDRTVRLATYHHAGGPDLTDSGAAAADVEEEFRWAGRVTRKSFQQMGDVRLPTSELLNEYRDVIGGGDNSLEIDNVEYVFKRSTGAGISSGSRRAGVGGEATTRGSNILKDGRTSNSILKTFAHAIQVRDQIVLPATQNADRELVTGGVGIPEGHPTDPILDNEIDKGVWEDKKKNAVSKTQINNPKGTYEVMAFDRLSSSTKVSPLVEVEDIKRDEIFSWHILSLYAAVHLSTEDTTPDPNEWDIFTESWSIGAKDQYVSSIVSDLEELILETRWATIDNLVWGHSGNPVKMRARLLEMMAGAGFKEGVTQDGKLFIFREGTLGIDDVHAARNNTLRMQAPSDKLREESGGADRNEVVKVRMGDTPITDPESHTFRLDDPDTADLSSSRIQQTADMTLDLSFVDPERVNVIRDEIVARLLIQSRDVQRLTATFDDFRQTGGEYGIGKLVELDDPPIEPDWLVDSAGKRVGQTKGKAEFAGRITRNMMHTSDREKATAYTLRIILLPSIGKLRAPSGIVRIVDRLDQDGDGIDDTHALELTGEGTTESTFGDVKADARRFTVGDEVRVFRQDGSKWSGSSDIREVKSINTTNNEILVDAFRDGSGNIVDPPTGSVVELAHIDSDGSGTGYENDGLNGEFSNVGRVYFYLADPDDGKIGDADLDADRYGG